MHANPPRGDASSVIAVRFQIDADADPGLLPRLLQPFAKRDLTPDRMWSHRLNGTMHVEIAVTAMPIEAVHLIEGNLGAVVGVRTVTQVRSSTLLRVA